VCGWWLVYTEYFGSATTVETSTSGRAGPLNALKACNSSSEAEAAVPHAHPSARLLETLICLAVGSAGSYMVAIMVLMRQIVITPHHIHCHVVSCLGDVAWTARLWRPRLVQM
jgi:hypothetical protein